MAMLPKRVAGIELSWPWKLPMGVREALTMTACFMARANFLTGCLFPARLRETALPSLHRKSNRFAPHLKQKRAEARVSFLLSLAGNVVSLAAGGIVMPAKVVETFKVEWLGVLDEGGHCDESLRPPLRDEQIKSLYEWMVLARTFDEKAFKLQRAGRLGTYASIQGQEAAQIGSAYALQPNDWMFPAFREPGASFVRGVPLRMLFQYWAGDERGSQIPENINDYPISIPVSTQIPIAVGAAMAAKSREDPIAVMAYMGDGATSKGDFHEGLNFAGVFSAPVVFVCQNNQWAISVPLRRQTAASTLAQKAIAYGFPGVQVDGNDVFAVYRAASEALARARQGGGPTFIECVTYRLGDHTTADDASRYRSREEVEHWRKKDPIERLRKYMENAGLWNKSYDQEVHAQATERVDNAVREEEAFTPADPADMFRFTYAEMPVELRRQMESFLNGNAKRELRE
jgi:pyruvate dehydrogenase E1 component alpha subunit